MNHNTTLVFIILFSAMLITGFARNQHPVGLALLWAGTLGMLGLIIAIITRALSICSPLEAFFRLC
ncbi:MULTISPECIES: hypothetical protein [Pseudomonas]|jgi:hypothetical protein|uniref:Uncharacterized protein n=2 Tax=Pseudomonas TaxID=286 RepID=A0A2X2CSD3_PSELU|nr:MULTISPECIES: hypothetical protein [Pseudomonas]ENA31812.1 hypothetical protein HMPREF1487_07243 [Pseudomonas sp. HPB0071]MBA1249480.1 hypothetical protein [Pseudomonas zeshuii]MBF8639285.1 hypothetical protein [Pseudomonas zeshuii]MBH3438635.1 hypothetical protein [Pseudomonas luteola]MBW5411476.1 hypothetical protein [Pseudomonas sp. MAG002Y]